MDYTQKQKIWMQRFEDRTEGMEALSTGLCPDCEECADSFNMELPELNAGIENGDVFDEGGFSWSGCDLCGNTLGNTLYYYHYIDSNGGINHGFGACGDCVCYIANGDVPDDEYIQDKGE